MRSLVVPRRPSPPHDACQPVSPIVARLLWKNASFGTFSHEPPRVRARVRESALPSRDQESKGLRHCGITGMAATRDSEFLRATLDRDMFLSRARTCGWESPETPRSTLLGSIFGPNSVLDYRTPRPRCSRRHPMCVW